ncbi:MAG: HWE histidine kinase domain-containing protein [Dongiaceae bacterium]
MEARPREASAAGRILVVDDNPPGLYAKARTLQRAGYEVRQAENGQSALALLRLAKADLVLLDVKLPDVSGIDLCGQMKREFPGTLVVQTSATFVDADSRVRGLGGGADAYITEPVEPAELTANVAALLRLQQAEEQARHSRRLADRRLAELEAVYANAPVGLLVLDGDLRYQRVNQRLAELAGRDAGLLIGESWQAGLPGGEPGLEALLRQTLQTGAPVARVTLPGPGERSHWTASFYPLRDHQDRVIGINGVVEDVTEQVRFEEHQRLLVQELSHRVKNALATVQSLAMQTARRSAGIDEFSKVFQARLAALARAHELLVRESWTAVSLREIVLAILEPYRSARGDGQGEGQGEGRVRLAGRELPLRPQPALALAMALHELATNAAKYGALSVPGGSVEIAWEGGQGTDRLGRLEWREHGGPPVRPPTRRGFGSRLIERGLAQELGAEVALEFHGEGVRCRIAFPHGRAP